MATDKKKGRDDAKDESHKDGVKDLSAKKLTVMKRRA